MDHRDDSGQPCARHPVPLRERLLELATVGSRAQGFHHDAASKLQSLVMALDEIGELGATAEPELVAAVEIAATALRELQVMFNDNRALARAQRSRIALPDLIARAAARVAVAVRGDVEACDVRVAVPAMVHALAQLFDRLSGPRTQSRAIGVHTASDGDRVTLTFASETAIVDLASEALWIATFVVDRDEGELRCAPAHVTVELPIATDTGVVSRP
jgi:hypothetical protein